MYIYVQKIMIFCIHVVQFATLSCTHLYTCGWVYALYECKETLYMNMRKRERIWQAWWVREMNIYVYICIYVFMYIYIDV